MIYNYDFDIAALFILFVGGICLKVRPQSSKKIAHWLTCLLWLAVAFNIFDILSNIMIAHPKVIPDAITYVVVLFYFSAVFFIPYILFLYFVAMVNNESRFSLAMSAPAVLSWLVMLLFNYKYEIYFMFDDHGIYSLGNQIWLVYLLWGIYLIAILAITINNKMLLGEKRVYGTIFVFGIAIICSIAQLLFPNVLTMGIGMGVSVVALIIVYFYIDDSLDRMTGISGAGAFYRETQVLLSEGHQQEYLMIRMDIQHFRNINERYGMEMGDLILKKIALKLQEIIKGQGTCARLSSDDFVCCIPRQSVEHRVFAIDVRKIEGLENLAREIIFQFGVYQIKDRSLPIDTMSDCATYALRRISGSSTDRINYFDDEMQETMDVQRTLEREMRDALRDQQFQVYYQPIYDLKTQELVSAEALIRWKHPTIGMISQGIFVPLFEKNGFITKLDQYIITQVCSDIREWLDDGKKTVPVSVNLSREDLNNDFFQDYLLEEVERFNLTSADLKLEVTESSFTQDLDQLTEILQKFRQQGFKILMDDFGSGYSSFYMFQNMPVDILKIDMQFLDNMDHSKRGKIIIESIVEMAKKLEIPVIVEGVEREDQATYLRELSCEQVQGFYFSRPLEKEIFEQMI